MDNERKNLKKPEYLRELGYFYMLLNLRAKKERRVWPSFIKEANRKARYYTGYNIGAYELSGVQRDRLE